MGRQRGSYRQPRRTRRVHIFRSNPWMDQTARKLASTESQSPARTRQYLPIRRRWSAGDVIRVQFNMKPQLLESNAQVIENSGRVAVQRGPLVYCLEQIDQPEGVPLRDVTLNLGPKSSAPFQENFRRTCLAASSCCAMRVQLM